MGNDQNLEQYQKSQQIQMPLTDYYLNKYSGGETQNKPDGAADPYLKEGQNSLMASVREQMRARQTLQPKDVLP